MCLDYAALIPAGTGALIATGTTQVIMLGSCGELLQQCSMHAHRNHFRGALTDCAAASLAQLVDRISTLSLAGPRLDRLASDRHAVVLSSLTFDMEAD